MPVVRMPDGAEVSFPDDMPKEQIKSLIASKFPDVAPKAEAPAQEGYQRSTILPLGKDLATGEISMAVPGLLQGLFESGKAAVTAPGRAYSGELQVMGPDGHATPEAIAEGFNFASLFSPASPASGLAAKASRVIPEKVLSEGEQVAAAGQRLGVDLPRAVTSDRTAVQQMGKVVSNVPIAGTPLRKASEKAVGQLDETARGVERGLGSGERSVAGAKLREGISDYSKNTLGSRITALEDDVSKAVDQAKTTPLSKTRQTVEEITSKRQAGALSGEGKAAGFVSEATKREGMTFEGLRTLRTSVREMLDNPTLIPADISQSELKRIYSSLTDDLRSAALNAGGKDGLSKFEKANRTEALIARDRESLQRILGRNTSDEKVADNILAMAGNTSRANIKDLMKARAAVSRETWDELSSSALAKMGRDAEGNFTPDRFLTSWGKMNNSSRKILFGGQEVAQSLDDIAKVSSRFKQLNQFANPSGTGQTATGAAYLSGVFLDPMTVVGSIAGTNMLARVMAKPRAVKEMAAYAKAYETAAKVPSAKTAEALAIRARALALIVANDNPAVAPQIASSLSSVQKVASKETGVGGKGAEIDHQREGNRPRYLMPNEI